MKEPPTPKRKAPTARRPPWPLITKASLVVALICLFVSSSLSCNRKLEEARKAKDNTVVCRAFTTDGCDYLLPEGSDTLTHRADCRNPVHWEHVLSDTSWWWKVRAKRVSK